MSELPLKIIQAESAEEMEFTRRLFIEYENFLPFDLSFQDFDKELAELPGQYAAPSGCILLAMFNSQSIGCVAVRPISSTICEMKRLFIKPEFHRLGIGTHLAMAIIERARRMGYQKMRLDTILEPAIAFYKSLNFKEIPAYRDVPLEGIVFMELALI
jgi:GNAT superfamily N-acetyltransferase